jgi:hypothetical protein
LKFALFVAVLNAAFKGVLCLMRRFCKNDKINAGVAGAVSGLAIVIDDAERR